MRSKERKKYGGRKWKKEKRVEGREGRMVKGITKQRKMLSVHIFDYCDNNPWWFLAIKII